MTNREQYTLLAELGMLCMTLTVTFSFSRIFVGGDWLWPLFVISILAHGIASTWRKMQAPTVVQVSAVLVGTVTAASWLLAEETMRWWLPTPNTFNTFGRLFAEAADEYTRAIAPIEATDAFVLATMVGIVVVGLMAELGTFTIYTPLQAVIPLVTLFGLTSALGNGRNATFFTLMFVASASMFFLGYNRSLMDDKRTRWVNHSADQTNSSLLRSGVTLATITLAFIAIIGPALPDTLDRALWSWRKTTNGAGEGKEREVINPLVDIQGRLVNQSREIAFTVRSDQGAYWRLMSLDHFDGRMWGAHSRFRSVSGRFETDTTRSEELIQQVRVVGLVSDYLPAAARPVAVFTANSGVAFDDHSSSLLLEHPTDEGFEYIVNSVLPNFEAETLRSVDMTLPDSIAARYLQLPELDPRVHELAREVTGSTTTSYDAALALQTFFRNEFVYDIDISAGSGENALVHFLFEDRRGYCEQFAASYAAMARTIGLPSRVAVGFTEGDQSQTDPSFFTVRGKHSHAWPEIFFPGLGWVPFEPTPGRYSPGSAAWTTLSPEQAIDYEETTPADLNDEPVVPTEDTLFPADLFPEFNNNDVGAEGDTFESPANTGFKLLATITVALALWVLSIATLRWLYIWWQDRRDLTPNAKILRAWQRVANTYSRLNQPMRVSETYNEYADRMAAQKRKPMPSLETLAAWATEAHYSTHTLSEQDAALVRKLASEELRTQKQRQSLVRRILDALAPRLS